MFFAATRRKEAPVVALRRKETGADMAAILILSEEVESCVQRRAAIASAIAIGRVYPEKPKGETARDLFAFLKLSRVFRRG